jgi:hypothetical protein
MWIEKLPSGETNCCHSTCTDGGAGMPPDGFELCAGTEVTSISRRKVRAGRVLLFIKTPSLSLR